MSTQARYTLTFSCPDQTGIVAAVTALTASFEGWIVEAAQHSQPDTGRFYMRQEIRADSLPFGADGFRERFAPIAERFGMNWKLRDPAVPQRVVLFCGKQDHCIADLLHRWSTGDLRFDLAGVVSNHGDLRGLSEYYGAAFHHVPIPKADAPPPDDKAAAFARVDALCDELDAETLVLARFMQVMPPYLCAKYDGRMINIHHSFLPSFIGARPYQQAFERGVKLVGATCHYVTPDLDAGPIIEQDVIRVTHAHDAAELARRGRDVERLVLTRGLRYHLEDRVLRDGNKTVVFA
ncbi:MAG: formyltetrahydrofolate deformylase [Planctomycetota bacterium]